MLAIIAAGQGSQSPAMLSAWLKDSTLRDTCAAWSLEIGVDLLTLGTSAGAEEIKDTAVAQPLIVAAGLLSFKALGVTPTVVAGHSVGEITAASLATIISEIDAMKIVTARGNEMAKAAAITPAGMSAVLGGEREAVVAAITAAGLVAANENGGGQIVAAGSFDALEKLAANPLKVRAFVRSLLPGRFTPLICNLPSNHFAHSLPPLTPTILWQRSSLIKKAHKFQVGANLWIESFLRSLIQCVGTYA